MADSSKKRVQAPKPCKVCQVPRASACGRDPCGLRRPMTAHAPDGMTFSGRIDTSTKEWME